MKVSKNYKKLTAIATLYILLITGIILATLYLLPLINESLKLFAMILVAAILIVILLNLIGRIYTIVKKQKLYELCEKQFSKCEKLYQVFSEEIKDYYSAIEELDFNKTIRCSNSVVANASTNEAKYVLKYTNINYSTEALEKLDLIKTYLTNHENFVEEMNKCKYKILSNIPFILRPFIQKYKIAYTISGLDYEASIIDYAKIKFRYVSPAGKAAHSHLIKVTIDLLDELSQEISKKIGKTGHAKAQRSKMTNDLREAIKKRDNYTCQICGNSVLQEPNLLLEVDHIIPIAKGGKTEASNLQTLCWRCNREKHDN